jgi:hypothetical protein
MSFCATTRGIVNPVIWPRDRTKLLGQAAIFVSSGFCRLTIACNLDCFRE